MAAVTAAMVGGVATAGAAKMSSDAAKKAGRAAEAGAQAGVLEQRNAQEQFQQNITPYLNAGQGALTGLNALAQGDYSGFQNSPDYLWALEQGVQAQDRSAAARGSLYSGGHQADLMRFGQGLASQQLGTYRNSLMDLARLGQNSAVGAGQLGQQSANAISGLHAGAAQARGDVAINQANAWGNALNGIAGAAGGYVGQRQSSYTNANSPYATMGNGVQVGGTAFGTNTYRGGW